MPSDNLLLKNGRFWTANPAQPWAENLFISGGRITRIGSDREVKTLITPGTQILDLAGRLCLPGLWDAHIHFYNWSLARKSIKLTSCRSLQGMLDRIRRHLELDRSDHWVTGWGWSETDWERPEPPTRLALDEITGPERPALFYRSDLHSAVANTAALELAGLLKPEVKVKNGVVEVDEDGVPTGILRELAVNVVSERIPAPTEDEIDQALLAGQRELHRHGITAVCDQRMKDQSDGPKALSSLARLNRAGKLQLRVNCNIAAHQLPMVEGLGLQPGMGDDRLRLGHIKIFTDGTLGSRTALMLDAFEEEPDNKGMYITPKEQIANDMRWAAGLGFPLSIHAIGDAANRVCLELFQELDESELPRPRIPHRLEHVQFLADDDLGRLVELGLTASMQPGHILDDMDTADRHLGSRARLAYRLRSLADRGTLLAFGSDAPVSNISPFYGIHGALFRQRPERMAAGSWQGQESLTLEQTLHAYTLGAAKAAGWSALVGSLEPGKLADLCVLEDDLFQLVEKGVTGEEILNCRVYLTLVEGKIVYSGSKTLKQP